jgi:ketosteroid isomerase-like protein
MAQNEQAAVMAVELTGVERVQTLFDAFNRGDIPFILSHVTDDSRWIVPGQGVPIAGEYRGPEGVDRFFQILAETEQLTVFEPREFFSNGETVAVLGAEEMRVVTNGNTARTNWAMIFRLRDGKVAYWETCFDTAAYARAHQGAL